jgi:pseudouridine synthase
LERLQKYLAHAGIGSRRKCEELIIQGKVTVNDEVVTLGTKIDPAQDIVKINGKVITKKEAKIYLMLNKPAGYVTTAKDNYGRFTVLDLVKDVKARIYPVGRLDYETEGLLLLTNDGQLAYRLTHPKYEITKVYQALVKGVPKETELNKLREGIILEDGLTAPAGVQALTKLKDQALIEISIHEGRNRQVRRMFEAIGHPVLKLKRIKMGPLSIDIPVGEYRFLTEKEIQALKKHIKLNN